MFHVMGFAEHHLLNSFYRGWFYKFLISAELTASKVCIARSNLLHIWWGCEHCYCILSLMIHKENPENINIRWDQKIYPVKLKFSQTKKNCLMFLPFSYICMTGRIRFLHTFYFANPFWHVVNKRVFSLQEFFSLINAHYITCFFF